MAPFNLLTAFCPETAKERGEKYLPPENCNRVCTVTVNEEIWDLLPRRDRIVDLALQRVQDTLIQGLSSLALLADKLSKGVQSKSPLNTTEILHHVMDSLVLITQANWSLNMKRRELIKPTIEAPFTRVCEPDIATTTKLFGDDLPKQLKDMTEVNRAGKQLQKKAPEQKHHYQKPYDRPRFNPNKSQTLAFVAGQIERMLGHTCMGHIDDSLLVARYYNDCASNINDTIDLFNKLGFVVHPEKSVLKPTQEIEFLGFIIILPRLLVSSLHAVQFGLISQCLKKVLIVPYTPRHVSAKSAAYPSDPRLCIVTHLNAYKEKTKSLRGVDSKLFFSYVKPHKAVSKDTISRWIRTVMMNAGLDVTIFKPHSTRSAATSKATQACVPIQDILKQAGWSNHRKFDRFYNKPVRKESSFAESVLKVD
ncbi:Gag-Pro-Pol poly [Paramuricea clavata]|uniref:Gag-Pro-Pol poly n=1 Tax=Paramuricea clavata TaxID=317549 RepID=A0A7D9J1L6_PARCT|nr:Gag-Pro-Pol poly [Paramuricea clavata]